MKAWQPVVAGFAGMFAAARGAIAQLTPKRAPAAIAIVQGNGAPADRAQDESHPDFAAFNREFAKRKDEP